MLTPARWSRTPSWSRPCGCAGGPRPAARIASASPPGGDHRRPAALPARRRPRLGRARRGVRAAGAGRAAPRRAVMRPRAWPHGRCAPPARVALRPVRGAERLREAIGSASLRGLGVEALTRRRRPPPAWCSTTCEQFRVDAGAGFGVRTVRPTRRCGSTRRPSQPRAAGPLGRRPGPAPARRPHPHRRWARGAARPAPGAAARRGADRAPRRGGGAGHRPRGAPPRSARRSPRWATWSGWSGGARSAWPAPATWPRCAPPARRCPRVGAATRRRGGWPARRRRRRRAAPDAGRAAGGGARRRPAGHDRDGGAIRPGYDAELDALPRRRRQRVIDRRARGRRSGDAPASGR